MNFFKWTALGVGGVVAVAHIGVLGHIIKATKVPEAPTINFPRGNLTKPGMKIVFGGFKNYCKKVVCK